MSLVSLSSVALCLQARPEPARVKHLSDTLFKGKPLAFPTNTRLGWKKTNSILLHKEEKSLVTLSPGPNVIKLFTTVIYCHSIVIPSFCVIKQHCLGNNCRMAVNYCDICVTNVMKHNLTKKWQ
jgi:hypothetical protein